MQTPYSGEIRMFGGNFAPKGWAFCNGQLIAISENETLFALIGTTYGGDGQMTFALPDLRGRLPLHRGQNPVTGTSFAIGGKGGAESVVLTGQQLPVHTHSVHVSSQPGTQKSPAQNVWAQKIVEFTKDAPAAAMNPASLSVAGQSLPHDNMMPYGVVSFIIALEGIYPSPG